MEEFLVADLYDTTWVVAETCTIPEKPEDEDRHGFSEEQLIESIKTPKRPSCSDQGEESLEDLTDSRQQRLNNPGEKKFICDHCDKRFSQLGHLKRHQCVHKREKKEGHLHWKKALLQRYMLEENLVNEKVESS